MDPTAEVATTRSTPASFRAWRLALKLMRWGGTEWSAPCHGRKRNSLLPDLQRYSVTLPKRVRTRHLLLGREEVVHPAPGYDGDLRIPGASLTLATLQALLIL